MSKKVIIVTVIILMIILIGVILLVYKRKRNKFLKDKIESLDIEKNLIESTPIAVELSKLETITKTDKVEEKYNLWQERFEDIKANNINKINDMIIDLDLEGERKSYNEYITKLCRIEIEIAKAKTLTNTLLDEIKEITLSEEKYRSIVTKLKTRFRELNNSFGIHRKEYGDIAEVIELQFENIEKRFQDFENAMEKNEYDEVVHIVKAIDSMVDHMGIIISEVPDLILLSCKLIPKRLEQINEIYNDMLSKEYPLEYLQIPYNVEQTNKNVSNILDRIKVLNLEDCMFELKTMLEYLDSLFIDFEKEKNSRKQLSEFRDNFEKKLKKINSVVSDIYSQLDEIKNLYDLKDDDITIIDDVNVKLIEINKKYKQELKNLKKLLSPYSEVLKHVEQLSNELKQVDEELDISLKSLGHMYEDEVRAREQLDEIQELLKQSKVKMRSYKLPIITNDYFVQLSEANEAILEIIKELDKKPIVIKTLNVRVDTARDLVLKLYNTTNETIKYAKLSELCIVYGNRYRNSFENVDQGLTQAEILFYKGNYKRSLEVSTRVIESIEENFSKKINKGI
ncbi:MAG: septation ring formation regulator EzrA [bacterium]|nr:septation ring formation regulator EzrA [bacterium]